MTKPRITKVPSYQDLHARYEELNKQVNELKDDNADLVKRIAELTSAVDNEPATCCGPVETTGTKFLPDSPEDRLLRMFQTLDETATVRLGRSGKKVTVRDLAYALGYLRSQVQEAYGVARLIKEYETK